MGYLESLALHIKETIDRLDGYKTGRLIVEEGIVSLLQSDNSEIQLDKTYIIEIRCEDKFFSVEADIVSNTKSTEGWPLYAGLYARVKKY